MTFPIRSVDILIIGGGCSGVAAAAAISSLQQKPLKILIAERSAAVARGIAYSTELDQHLLNVPAAQMGIHADRPRGFSDWLAEHHIQHRDSDFVSRRLYGEYLDDTLRSLLSQQCENSFSLWPSEVVDLKHRGEDFLACGLDGDRIVATAVVLAVGHNKMNIPIEEMCGTPDHRFFADPWSADGYKDIETLQRIVVIGSGLTAMDVVGTLLDKQYTGEIILISRRGLLPPASTGSLPVEAVELPDGMTELPLRSLIKNVRALSRARLAAGLEWRPVVDALRSATPEMWNHLTITERKSFLRHVRPYWEVARHRMPGQIREKVDRGIESGTIKIIRGRVQRLDFTDDSMQLSVLIRVLNSVRELKVDRVFSCAGSGSLKASALPALLDSLVSHGLARLDPCGLGIECTLQGEVCGADQKPVRGLYALGPLRRASEWESTAVREIRNQALMVAKLLSQAGSL